MLTDVRLWYKYPFLCIVRFMQNTIRTTALLFFVMVISLLTTEQSIKNLPVAFIGVSLGLNWALMFFFGAKLRRYKIWLYPLMFVVNPFFNWVYMVYGIFTAGQRTWGGPRADAAAADVDTSPQEAIAIAKAQGDDLNVVPESFKPAAEARHPGRHIRDAPLHPSSHLGGRFTIPEEMPGGWYMHSDIDSALTLPLHLRRRDSMESWNTRNSNPNHSMHMPLTLEAIMSEEDQRKRRFAQAASREASSSSELDLFEDRGEEPGLMSDDIGDGHGFRRVYEVSDSDSNSPPRTHRRHRSRTMASLSDPQEFDLESQLPPSPPLQASFAGEDQHSNFAPRPHPPSPDVSSPLSPRSTHYSLPPSPANLHHSDPLPRLPRPAHSYHPRIPSGLSQEWRSETWDEDDLPAPRAARRSRLDQVMHKQESNKYSGNSGGEQNEEERGYGQADEDDDEEPQALELSARHFASQMIPSMWQDQLQRQGSDSQESEEEAGVMRGRARTTSMLHGQSLFQGYTEGRQDYDRLAEEQGAETDQGGLEMQNLASSSRAQGQDQGQGVRRDVVQERGSKWKSVGRKLRKRR